MKHKRKGGGHMKRGTEGADLREREAYHEAGHAVARVLLGLPFVAVSIERKTKRGFHVENGRKIPVEYILTEGISWADDYTEAVNADLRAGKLDLREAVAAMAGPSAEAQLVGCIDETAQQGAQNDMQQIGAACRAAMASGKPPEHWTPTEMEGDFIRAAAGEAAALLGVHWPKVEALAAALLQHRRLTREQAARIVEGAA